MSFLYSQRYIVWILAITFLALALWRPWTGAKPDLRKLWSIDLSTLEADITLEGVRYTRAENGKPLWVMDAKVAKIFEDRGVVNMEKIVIYFFQEDGNNLVIKADRGTYDMKQQKMRMNGNVDLKSVNGDSLATQTLGFDQKRKVLWSEKDVVIHSQGLVIKGSAFEYYLDKGRFLVFNQQSTIVESDSLSFK